MHRCQQYCPGATCDVLKHLLHDVLQLVIRKVKLVGEIDWPGCSIAVAVVAELCDARGQACSAPVVDTLVQPVTADKRICNAGDSDGDADGDSGGGGEAPGHLQRGKFEREEKVALKTLING